jgi:cytochrome P450
MPYTRSAIPNIGDTIIVIDKIMANALEPLPLEVFHPPLKPAIMLAIPPNSKAMAASNITKAAEAKVLMYDHRNFKKGKRLQAAKALLGEGLVTSEGDFHNRQRRLIQPIFHPRQIMGYGKIMTDYAIRLRDRWKNEDILDISQEMMQLTLGIICKSVLNYDIESEAKQVGKALTTTRNYSK